ncbi:RNA polymerase sigma factor [Robiginitalea biformata]|uniref:Putative RNA polymerase ECF-type sigma factor n=1 Tax=Robiginitalea biformata (strain ATCC BAA-864 / DSM 15991 / KCTC 12146 / HTCC2501) TaxID=313596 RepID=A4CHW3_ROBBH|nr:sigma-70 family RNA polymerase sigma factor [Robiginitalea biformata]EAR16521.1 putative RNA polymerase ECF-type sigma factor [Robiginitalea biformata HTCC2501]
MTQKELIRKCKKGNRAAQEELYRTYSAVLFGICLKYSRNKTEAEDNLHDSFMTVYEKIHQFRDKGSFEGWLKRITVNTVLQKYRKKEPLSLVEETPDPDGDPEPGTGTGEELSLGTLLQFVQELPEKYRITFNLYVLDGYSHKEISESLGTSEGTSKSNLARARAILRDRIKNTKINIA